MRLPPQEQQRVLGDLLGQLGRPKDLEGFAVDVVAVRFYESPERGLVALDQALD